MASGSSSGNVSLQTFEAKMEMVQNELDELRQLFNQQGIKLKKLQKTRTNRWELLNQELKEIRDEMSEDLTTNMKDTTVMTGGLGNQLVKLEKKVEDFIKEHGKTPKSES